MCCSNLDAKLSSTPPELIYQETLSDIWHKNVVFQDERCSFLKGNIPHDLCVSCLSRYPSHELYFNERNDNSDNQADKVSLTGKSTRFMSSTHQ